FGKWNFSDAQELWLRKPDWEVGVKSAVISIIMALGILGNGAVIYIILSNPPMKRSPTNMFILNMCIADLLLLVIYPVFFLLEDFYQAYPLGYIGCKLQGFTYLILRLVEAFTLTVISIDRLLAVIHPLRPPIKRRTAIILSSAIWVCAGGTSTPLVVSRDYLYRQWKDFTEITCEESKEIGKPFWLYMLIFLVWIPTACMIVSYSWIFFKLKVYEKRVSGDENPVRTRQKRQIVRMLFVVLLVFTLTWLPFQVLILFRFFALDSFQKDSVGEWYVIARFLSRTLSLCSSALNPVVYGLAFDNFRKAFRISFPCFFSEQKYEYVRSGQLWSRRKILVLPAEQGQKPLPDRSPTAIPGRTSRPTPGRSASSNRMTAFVNPIAEMPDVRPREQRLWRNNANATLSSSHPNDTCYFLEDQLRHLAPKQKAGDTSKASTRYSCVTTPTFAVFELDRWKRKSFEYLADKFSLDLQEPRAVFHRPPRDEARRPDVRLTSDDLNELPSDHVARRASLEGQNEPYGDQPEADKSTGFLARVELHDPPPDDLARHHSGHQRPRCDNLLRPNTNRQRPTDSRSPDEVLLLPASLEPESLELASLEPASLNLSRSCDHLPRTEGTTQPLIRRSSVTERSQAVEPFCRGCRPHIRLHFGSCPVSAYSYSEGELVQLI
ncbi:unnamed protein product, partial [Darwinula stevensoni]